MKSAVTAMPPMRIREAGANDASAILACLAAAFEEFRNQYSTGAFADTVLDSETVQHRLREMCVLLAVAEGRVMGTISWSANGAEGICAGWPFSRSGKGGEWRRHCSRRLNRNYWDAGAVT
jgi:hypothetical protein